MTCASLRRASNAHGSQTRLYGTGDNVVPMNGNAVAGQADQGTVDELTEPKAWQALSPACDSVGLDASGARLLRLGEHAVFRLAKPVVVRIGRSLAYEEQARTEVGVARWLENQHYPAARAAGTPAAGCAEQGRHFLGCAGWQRHRLRHRGRGRRLAETPARAARSLGPRAAAATAVRPGRAPHQPGDLARSR